MKTKSRHTIWNGGYIEWVEGNTIFISVVFSWQLQRAYQTATWYRKQGFNVIAGGPAVELQPWVLKDIVSVKRDINALWRHNSMATFTSRACIRNCAFCAVPALEGDIRELSQWETKPIVCDNNLLACSRKHFDLVIDRLKGIQDIDFNQGLDCRLITPYIADRIGELNLRLVRLSWDNILLESAFMKAVETLKNAGIPKSYIRAYVLIGFNDDPADALYRLQKIRNLGLWTNPMRYQPIMASRRNCYVGEKWTQNELTRYMRYWQNLRKTGAIPFNEFR